MYVVEISGWLPVQIRRGCKNFFRSATSGNWSSAAPVVQFFTREILKALELMRSG
jgi:hypothetical protein